MSEGKLTPLETVVAFKNEFSQGDVQWILLTLLLVFVLFKWSSIERTIRRPTHVKAILWITGLIGWFFLMVMFVHNLISESGWEAYTIMAAVAAGFAWITLAALRKAPVYEQVVAGMVRAIIVFGTFASFGMGNQPYGYACIMGSIFGALLGALIVSILYLNMTEFRNRLNEEVDRLARKSNINKSWKSIDVSKL